MIRIRRKAIGAKPYRREEEEKEKENMPFQIVAQALL